MDAAELRVSSVRAEDGGGVAVPARARLDAGQEALVVSLGRAVRGRLTVEVEYEGELNDRMLGFYLSRYKEGGRERRLATTQFEAADARRAFPCFDEPAAKATFDISIVARGDHTAISNMPVASKKRLGGRGSEARTLYAFETTPVMPTYLVYMGVGEFEFVGGTTGDGVAVRVAATRGNAKKGRYALGLAKELLGLYGRYFGSPYPLPKLDLIAVPDFAAGAMENWGAITFREAVLLYDPKTSSTRTKQFIAEVVSHEIAHQWFGNLVTMKWWNDLWLNESFATFMATKFVHMLHPEWDMWDQFAGDAVATAMSLDALRSTHPIDVVVSSPSEIREIFDAISYDKGGSILLMLEDYVGEAAFRRGLRRYLKDHAYGNAAGSDLWDAIGAASGLPVKRLVQAWIGRGGFPMVEASRRGPGGRRLGGGRLRLGQERFAYEPRRGGGRRAGRRRGGAAGTPGGGAGRAGAEHPFWDKEIVVSVNKKRRPPERKTTARRILGRVLSSPDGYTVGFDGFIIKTVGGRRACNGNDGFGGAFHARFGRRLVAKDAAASYCAVFAGSAGLGAVAYAGPESGVDASKIVRRIARAGGGRPDKGGSRSFAQAGGLDESRGDKARMAALEAVLK